MATHFKLLKEGSDDDWYWGVKAKEEDCFMIIDIDKSKAFETKISKDVLDHTSARMKNQDIHNLAKLAFSSEATDSSFVFSIEKDQALSWKKQGKITLKLGKFPMKVIDFKDALTLALDAAFTKMTEQAHKIQRLEKNVNDGNAQRKGYEIAMAEMTETKNSLEQEYFSQFLPILHSKQDKIRELEKEIEEFRKGNGDTSDTKVTSKTHTISSSEDDEDGASECSKRLRTLDDSQNFLNLSMN